MVQNEGIGGSPLHFTFHLGCLGGDRESVSNYRPCILESREIMHLVASIRQRTKKSQYQSKVFACVSNVHADVVNQLLLV